MRETAITVDRQPLRLRVSDDARTDVVLLHGIPGSGRSWDDVLARLPATVRPIVPDLLGFGGSGRSLALDDLHAEGQACRLAGALDTLGIRRPVLVGHDFGGPVALRLIMREPDRYAGLVLASTNVFADTPVPFPLSLVRARLVGGIAARALFSRPALKAMCRFGARCGRVDCDPAIGDRGQSDAIAAIFAGSLTDLPGLYGPIERTLPSLRIPVHVLWGTRDPFFPVTQARRTAAAIPGAALTLLEDRGHFLPDEAPDEFAAAIAAIATTSTTLLEERPAAP